MTSTPTLTPAEIKALEDASWTGGRTAWLAAIEGIIAERLAAVEALVAEWEREGRAWPNGFDFRAALRGDTP